MNPLFSIITVSYNAEKTIPATLKSVSEQTCRLFEYIVIDGASGDNTVGIVNKSGIDNLILISEPDRGIYDAMNKGLGIAKGDYVIFLNAGDSFHSPHTLEIIANAAMDNDYPGIVYGQTQLVNSQRERVGDRHLKAPEILTLDSLRMVWWCAIRRSLYYVNLWIITTPVINFQRITNGVYAVYNAPIGICISTRF